MGQRFGRSPSGVRQRSRRSQEIRGSALGHGALRLPAKCRRDLAGNRVQHLRVVLDAKLTGHSKKNGVGRLHGGVLGQFFGDPVRLAAVATSEAAEGTVEPADLILVPVSAKETAIE